MAEEQTEKVKSEETISLGYIKVVGTTLLGVIVTVAAWTLTTVISLQSSTATLINEQKNLTENLKAISEDFRRNREVTDRLKDQVTRLEAILDRLDRAVPSRSDEKPQ